ncbi:hypothetical protein B0H12DRAFT_1109566 [Mycena haematopus]|nr:hypothetical protein B0H12DRAFT_1109566 [Mycena haematopus]
MSPPPTALELFSAPLAPLHHDVPHSSVPARRIRCNFRRVCPHTRAPGARVRPAIRTAPPLLALQHLELWIHADNALAPAAISVIMSVALRSQPPSHLRIFTINIRERIQRDIFDWSVMAKTQAPEWPILDHQLLKMHTERLKESSKPRQNMLDNGPSDAEDGHWASPLENVHFSLRNFREALDRYASFVSEVKGTLPRVLGVGLLAFSYRGMSRMTTHPMDRFSQV